MVIDDVRLPFHCIHLLTASTHSSQMNARMRLGYLPYNRKKESRNIIYTYFELYDYSQTDNEITRGDEETKRYLQIGAWKYITPPEARKKPEKQDEKEEEKDVKEEKGVKDVRDEKDVKSEKDVKKDEKDVSDEKDVKPTGTIWTTRLRARQ